MKALKEKRISLRSLWRRGLVILSLFALLFAACSDSTTEDTPSTNGDGDGSGSVSKGKFINKVVITKLPARQYLGTPVDLEGIEATVYYSDGSAEKKTDKSQFAASPRIVWGYYKPTAYTDVFGDTQTFYGMERVLITYGTGRDSGANYWEFAHVRQPTTDELNASGGDSGKAKKAFTDRVIGIARDNTKAPTPDWVTDNPYGTGYEGLYEQGLSLTGVLDMTKKTYYVDDDKGDINWANLKLEAFYDDGATKKIDFENVHPMILPDYKRDKNADGTWPGWLYITVGALDKGNLNFNVAGGDGFRGPTSGYDPIIGNYDPTDPTSYYDGGITKRVALEKVYTVETIKVVPKGTVPEFFFWQSNSPGAWEQRLIKGDTYLEITYAGNPPSKTLKVEDLVAQKKIWWNNNPTESSIIDDFAILPLEYPFTVKAHPNPHILVYYRGGLSEPFNVDVYTTLQDLTVTPTELNWESDLPVDGQDNDVEWDFGKDEKAFSKAITVTAVYASYNAGQKPSSEPVPLEWKASMTSGSGSTPGDYYGPYYTTNYATIRQGIKKTDTTKAVTIIHTISATDVFANLSDPDPIKAYSHHGDMLGHHGSKTASPPTYDELGLESLIDTQSKFGVTKSGSKKTNVTVTWTKKF